MANRDYYIEQMPGLDAGTDAYNLVQATLNDDRLMARMLVEHQIDCEGIEEMLAAVVAWYVSMLRALRPQDAGHILAHIRDVCEQS